MFRYLQGFTGFGDLTVFCIGSIRCLEGLGLWSSMTFLLCVELRAFGVLKRFFSDVYKYGTVNSPLGHQRFAFLGP